MTHLKRYTELPYVLQTLETRRLTLANPERWDDKNDAHFMSAYRLKAGLGTVQALCLTEAMQTYHHWRVFTHGASGACIYFKKPAFLKWLESEPSLKGRPVQYKPLPRLKKQPPMLEDLPFIKRNAYEHEEEFRILYVSSRKTSREGLQNPPSRRESCMMMSSS